MTDRRPAPPLTPLEEQLDALLVAEIERQDAKRKTRGEKIDPRRCLLSETDIVLLLNALAKTRGRGRFTRREAAVLLDWAQEARLAQRTLGQVLRGEVGVDVREGVPYFIAAEKDDGEEVSA